jgi:uncharacterized membrane-anchored protein YitT (DUF2179 family)
MSNMRVYEHIKEYITIIIGLALYALGWTGFLLPHEITTGGVTGIGALLYYSQGIPVALTYLLINLVLLVISIRLIGWKFSIRTTFGVAVLTVFLSVSQSLIKKPILVEEPFMACVIGGVLAGIGIGMVFTANGSTGGTDIIALIVNKYKNITVGRAILYSDLIIISSSYLLFKSVEKILFGLTTLVIMTYAIDVVVNGIRQSVQFFIITHKHDDIAKRINEEVHRGVTILNATGYYSKEPVTILVVMAKKNESVKIFRIVKQVDPNAFVSQSSAIGVYGQGFDRLNYK